MCPWRFKSVRRRTLRALKCKNELVFTESTLGSLNIVVFQGHDNKSSITADKQLKISRLYFR
jgi:hypothetical protein